MSVAEGCDVGPLNGLPSDGMAAVTCKDITKTT